MARYKVFIKPSAVKEIEKIARKEDRQRIVGKIQALADDPRPVEAKKLSGAERYRLRQCSYRILYSIEDDELTVYVVKVGDRKQNLSRFLTK